jgi:hypothetical protein
MQIRQDIYDPRKDYPRPRVVITDASGMVQESDVGMALKWNDYDGITLEQAFDRVQRGVEKAFWLSMWDFVTPGFPAARVIGEMPC